MSEYGLTRRSFNAHLSTAMARGCEKCGRKMEGKGANTSLMRYVCTKCGHTEFYNPRNGTRVNRDEHQAVQLL